MIKYLFLVVPLFLFLSNSACKEQQTSTAKETNGPNNPGNIAAPLKAAANSDIPMSMVRNVKQASNGDMLIASYLGVFRYDGTSFINITKNIPSPSFWDVLEDRKENLWFGTRDSGVYLLPSGQTNFQHFTTTNGLASNYSATHLYEDKAGTIWVGTARGLSRYDGTTLPTGQSSFQNFTMEDGLPNNNINVIMEDSKGNLWLGTRGDACYYDGKTFTVLRNKNGDAFYNVWAFMEDTKGNIWFGGSIVKDKKGSTLFLETGLWRYDGSTIFKVSEQGAYAIIQDKKGNIWTTGEVKQQVWALSRYDANDLYNQTPSIIQIKQGKPMDFLGMLEANDGSIWFGSGAGVHRYNGETFTDFKNTTSQQ